MPQKRVFDNTMHVTLNTINTCSAKEKTALFKRRLLCYICAHNHPPILKHMSVAMTNLLGIYFLYLVWKTIHRWVSASGASSCGSITDRGLLFSQLLVPP